MGFLEPHGRGCSLFWRARLTGPIAPVIIIHSLAHAVGALKASGGAGCPITLLSASEAGIYAGPGWFRALVQAAREAVPDARFSAVLDCGDQAGAALAAIRAQIEAIVFTGREDVARRLADIARQHGVRLETTRPSASLDLSADFFASAESVEQRCADILERQKSMTTTGARLRGRPS